MSEWIKKLAEGYKTVNENQKAALQKKLAKASASQVFSARQLFDFR